METGSTRICDSKGVADALKKRRRPVVAVLAREHNCDAGREKQRSGDRATGEEDRSGEGPDSEDVEPLAERSVLAAEDGGRVEGSRRWGRAVAARWGFGASGATMACRCGSACVRIRATACECD